MLVLVNDSQNNFYRNYLPTLFYLKLNITPAGYPVLRGEVVFKGSSSVANKDDWNVFVMARKVSHSVECQDVLNYLQLSAGAPANPSYSFH